MCNCEELRARLEQAERDRDEAREDSAKDHDRNAGVRTELRLLKVEHAAMKASLDEATERAVAAWKDATVAETPAEASADIAALEARAEAADADVERLRSRTDCTGREVDLTDPNDACQSARVHFARAEAAEKRVAELTAPSEEVRSLRARIRELEAEEADAVVTKLMVRAERHHGLGYKNLEVKMSTLETQLELSLFVEGFRTAVALKGQQPREMPKDGHWIAGWETGRSVYMEALLQYASALKAKEAPL